jgi:hypothetical protein
VIPVAAASVGLIVAGPFGCLVGLAVPRAVQWWRSRPAPRPPLTSVLLLLLVELRSGRSVLAALIETSRRLPDYHSLRRVARVALVAGLAESIGYADNSLRPVVAQLARAQRTGASLSNAVRKMLESELSADRSRRVARARTLPVRLMIPVTLLMLPGMVLLLYAPSLLAMFQDLTGVLG